MLEAMYYDPGAYCVQVYTEMEQDKKAREENVYWYPRCSSSTANIWWVY